MSPLASISLHTLHEEYENCLNQLAALTRRKQELELQLQSLDSFSPPDQLENDRRNDVPVEKTGIASDSPRRASAQVSLSELINAMVGAAAEGPPSHRRGLHWGWWAVLAVPLALLLGKCLLN